jgi:hypothetical protein
MHEWEGLGDLWLGLRVHFGPLCPSSVRQVRQCVCMLAEGLLGATL